MRQDQDLITQDEVSAAPCAPSRQAIVLEVCVFLFLILPSMVLAYFAGSQDQISFVLLAVSVIFRDLGLVSLILFLAWRDREPVSRLGLNSRNLDGNILLGFVLYVPFLIVIGLVTQVLTALGLSQPSEPGPSYFHVGGHWELALAVVLVIVVAISEETIFRGYLIRRLHTATGSLAGAVLLSSIFFALGHGYEGSLGVITVGVMGLIFSLIYLWRKSLVVPIILHFLQDFIAIVVAPYLT
ncbi:MAG: CPBP family intramembrane metalloprotease [Planctomycetes bacterium]|nr:CPBP family intramembrane metalloprotease [Planctomycetota bacterium]